MRIFRESGSKSNVLEEDVERGLAFADFKRPDSMRAASLDEPVKESGC